ncbi:MAG: hypothetical protein ABWY00_16150, partial [Dongiaceae bacterium]
MMAQAVSSQRPKRSKSMRQHVVAILHCLALLAILLFCIFPFYWMVATSLKQQADALASPPLWLFTPTLENYRAALTDHGV